MDYSYLFIKPGRAVGDLTPGFTFVNETGYFHAKIIENWSLCGQLCILELLENIMLTGPVSLF